jgi:regulatory protein
MDEEMDRYNYIMNKARRYCAYQERCVFDLKKKLYEWKVRPDVSAKIINTLEEENYLDEERFARVFCGGKFRIKKWGRNKIMAELRARKIPDLIIQIGLDEIDEHEYIKVLKETIDKKRSELGKPNDVVNKQKLFNFVLNRGFEKHLVLKYF